MRSLPTNRHQITQLTCLLTSPRPRIRGVHSFCMESGGHRGDQRTASVRYQVDTQSDRTRVVEQVALAVLDGPSPILLLCNLSEDLRAIQTFLNLYDVFLLCLPRTYHRLCGYCR